MTLQAVLAANRFGLGARPGEITDIGRDPREWLMRQVERDVAVPQVIRALPSSAQAFEAYRELQEMRREARAEPASDNKERDPVANVRQKLAPLYLDQVAARYQVAVASTDPFRERLVHFWSNHFAVSADKALVAGLAGTLENEAIRPHLSGSFAELLLAAESHPAMILYLDNQGSIGPNSMLAQRASRRARKAERKLDINENLAREILELHTLGVNGGYTQADVTSFARVLTGWSVGGSRGPLAEGKPGVFEFRENMHEPGAQTVVGKRYSESGGAQAKAVLNDLARHPATANHVATKLVRHFVADEPPLAAVDHVAKVFRDTNGDLPSVHRAVIELPQAWEAAPRKFKTPHEFVISSFRALDFVPDKPLQIAAPFQLLGQRPYTPGSPAGWPDTAAQWDGPDALLKRIEWATQLSDRLRSRAKPLDIAAQSLGEALNERTRTAISRAASAAQGTTLLLASPEFMRR
ncbi:uncharacterized protein (DUF1800 family) [Povalibacter uvarum]|uniref:Uncharacterized protein (DUF1800 family) n=1 Tax=Povalibacter uvarum TaxID=732238 RepID=A0A841HJ51_9GAMM|nr:DUF1800 domain-containing protein [Povalibacter uvarum]MBB6092826.1 uncharacterized protein (DUF1800 family) [Povalibacter uvarum]